MGILWNRCITVGPTLPMETDPYVKQAAYAPFRHRPQKLKPTMGNHASRPNVSTQYLGSFLTKRMAPEERGWRYKRTYFEEMKRDTDEMTKILERDVEEFLYLLQSQQKYQAWCSRTVLRTWYQRYLSLQRPVPDAMKRMYKASRQAWRSNRIPETPSAKTAEYQIWTDDSYLVSATAKHHEKMELPAIHVWGGWQRVPMEEL